MANNSRVLSLDDAFWAKFSKRYWEKRPVCFRKIRSPLLELDADHIFELLVRYSDYCRKSGTAGGLKFYIDGQPQYLDDVLRRLPVRGDRSLAGYHSRMKKQFSDYCLVCDELLRVSLEKWDLLGTFMQGLYRHVGIPTRFAEIGLYLGNYRKTPFGVHVDGCGVLSLPVVGTKTFRLWDPRFVKKNPDLNEAFHYSAYKKSFTLLLVKPGDLGYWPSSYWHIAESNGSFSATWSIGVWVDRPYSESLIEAVKPLLGKKLGTDFDARSIAFRRLHRKDGRIERLPEIFDRSISALLHLPETQLRDVLLKFWLELASKRGFKNAPVPQPQARLRRGEWVRGNPAHPILWARLTGGGLCLAANGRLIDAPGRMAKLIQAVNSGKPYRVRRPGTPGEFEILEALYEARAIRKEPALAH